MTSIHKYNVKRYCFSLTSYLIIGVTLTLFGILFYDGIIKLINTWNGREEYSHGFLIPLLSIFFLWQNKNEISKVPLTGSITGVLLLTFGLFLFFLGKLSTLYIIIHYSMLLVIAGVLFSFTGFKNIRLFWVPLVFLIFMIPLPPFLYNNLSQSLQLISSEIGVAVTRLFGVSVFLEGNVIDLGTYKLQVVDACSGLRYLFPLMSFGFICAYLFKAPLSQRVLVFLSTIPITVLMNSFRIGVIGVLVDRWGTEQAEGFLHDFEGWVIFMACVSILFAEMWLLNRVFSKEKRPLREVFGLEFPEPLLEAACHTRKVPKPFIASLIILSIACAYSLLLNERDEIIPARSNLSTFPAELEGWQGELGELDPIYLQGLVGLTDHTIGDFSSLDGGDIVNLYVAYYESQRAEGSIHSPRSCIPGGGWVIESIENVVIDGIQHDGHPIHANRVMIVKGDYKQLVYYWFDQRGRNITNEYLLKWYLFWDSLTRHRSDGALIRLTTMIGPNESIEDGESRLQKFGFAIGNKLDPYIPQ